MTDVISTNLMSTELKDKFPETIVDLDAGVISFSTAGDIWAILDIRGVLAVMVSSENWDEALATHLENVTDLYEHDMTPGSTEWLSSLRVLIYDAEYGRELIADPAWTELAPGIQVAIVLDTATSVTIIELRDIELAELSYDEAFQIAMDQTKAIEFYRDSEGFATVVTGETADAAFYNGSSLLGPTDLFDGSGSLGTLIVIAKRGTTLLLDLEASSGGNSSLAVETVVTAGSNSYQDFMNEPGPGTPDMLWWFDGEFYTVEVSDSSIQLPDKLLSLLE